MTRRYCLHQIDRYHHLLNGVIGKAYSEQLTLILDSQARADAEKWPNDCREHWRYRCPAITLLICVIREQGDIFDVGDYNVRGVHITQILSLVHGRVGL